MCASRWRAWLLVLLAGAGVVCAPREVLAKRPRVPITPVTRDDNKPPVDNSNAPFRAKLVTNAAIVRRAAGSFASAAKQPAPPKLTADQRRLYNEHTKWLNDSAARLNALHTQMDAVLSKGAHAAATELAQTNMQFVTLCETFESESQRFTSLTAARARHAAAMSSLRGA